MSLHLPTRRIVSSAPSTLSSAARPIPRPVGLPFRQTIQVRTKFGLSKLSKLFGRRGRDGTKAEDVSFGGQDFDNPKVRERFQQQQKPQLSSSIFEEEVDEAVVDSSRGGKAPSSVVLKTPETTAWRLDPDPRSRIRWERKKVIQMVRRNGRVSRSERIAQTEKELSHKSPFLETSVKKLVHLARQIQGKTLDDALVQMAFSKKKMAREVKHQLEEARDLAVVTRGMGLGNAGQQNAKGATKPVKIQTRDGKGFTVDDPSSLYVAQAWVGKGPWRSKSLDYKGRGRFGIIQSPSTSISVVLKEEKTRIREHNERLARVARRKPWIHLPDRPVTAQRPYYSW
ncbi:hypothetical protein CSOJ01_13342 [Colletotrichum sojae]|uniref:Mitochondrial large ribosomal subunit n=1 Tax=Colletotrichum sojae TaxID=2175907 RepID=A0A8H6MKG4_9PEZI|nr:hypothetical protein CSOJ01_13342 [Colletotrichum sojae]